MNNHRLLLGFVALALVVSACGEGETGDTTSTTESGEVTTTVAGSETTTTAAGETTTTAVETTTTAATTGGDAGAFQEAIRKSGELNSAQMEGSMEMVGLEAAGEAAIVIGFSGAFDNENEVFAFKMDLSAAMAGFGEELPPEMAGLIGDMEIISVGDTAYMKFPFFAMFLGSDTEWIKMPADESGDAAGGFTGVSPANPTDMLAAFNNENVDVVEVGTEDVRGVATTHYHAVVDARAIAESSESGSVEGFEDLGELPDEMEVDFWIDDERFIRKYVIVIDGTGLDAAAGESFEAMTMTYEMFAFNEPIDVQIPSDSEVTDMEDLNFDFGDLDLGA